MNQLVVHTDPRVAAFLYMFDLHLLIEFVTVLLTARFGGNPWIMLLTHLRFDSIGTIVGMIGALVVISSRPVITYILFKDSELKNGKCGYIRCLVGYPGLDSMQD